MKQIRSNGQATKSRSSNTGNGRAKNTTGRAGRPRKNAAGAGGDEREDAVEQFNRYDDQQAPSYLEKFFIDQLKDIYYAEQKITEGLETMQKASSTDELRDAFQEHAQQTNKHVKRVEKVFSLINRKPEGKKCEAIEGILREAKSIIDETKQGTMTRDAALIFAAQKVEHYEIATYGGLVQFAITLGLHEVADILDRTLREEEDTDERLTEIAESDINLAAEHEHTQFSWDQQPQAVSETEAEV